VHLDPGDCHLLLADLQPELVSASATVPPEVIARAAQALVAFATTLDVPVTFSHVPVQHGEAAPISGLNSFVGATNHFIRHPSASPFLDPRVVERLREQGRRTLIVMGYASEVVVLHACLDGLEAGYRPVVPVDAVGGLSPRTERAALDHIATNGGMVTSAASLLSMWAPDFSRAPGDAALARIFDVVGG
jgi:hypothetical protein